MSAPSRHIRSKFAKIFVRLERRADGGLRAYSEDVPGFVLSHINPDAVLADVKPALEGILSYMLNANVEVEPLSHLRTEISGAEIIDDPPYIVFQAPVTLEYVTHIIN